ncbi:hypothetical protein [Paraburkholderia atlantica]|uniref:hypothetical protein n=1 Tax=Paraburkholderia atlantica TaxID=2654982 RepID=UPI003D23EFE5
MQMKDAFERRALLLHLADVLEAVNWAINHDVNDKTVRELAETNGPLTRFPLLRNVSAQMTSMEFARRATSAFVEWPRELLEPELNRKRLASSVQRNLFDGNAEGWRAYVAGLRADVPWFGVGLRLLRESEDARSSSTPALPDRLAAKEVVVDSEAARNGEPVAKAGENFETSQRIYPTWPWKS